MCLLSKQEVMESSIESPKLTTTNLAPEINTKKDQQIVDLIDEFITIFFFNQQ